MDTVKLHEEMSKVVAGMPPRPKSERIRRLKRAGFRQADIARFEGVLDQYVSNIARDIEPDRRPLERSPAPADQVQLQVGADGRLVIPADIRTAMGVRDGGPVIARFDDGELRLFTAEAGMRKARSILSRYVPSGVSLADELIRDRRREAGEE